MTTPWPIDFPYDEVRDTYADSDCHLGYFKEAAAQFDAWYAREIANAVALEREQIAAWLDERTVTDEWRASGFGRTRATATIEFRGRDTLADAIRSGAHNDTRKEVTP